MNKLIYSDAREVARKSSAIEFSEQISRFTEFGKHIPLSRMVAHPKARNIATSIPTIK